MTPITNVKTLSALCVSCIVTNDLLHKPEAEDLGAQFFIKYRWDELKSESHPVIQSKMTDIENKLALSCPLLDTRESFLTKKVDALFKGLADVFGASQFFGNTIPVDSVSYHQLLQKWEDEALLVLWNKGVVAWLGDQVPVYTSAQEIRAYLTDPTNTPLLQQITTLHLYSSGLKVIPPEMQNFPNLRNLFMSNNQISVIPEAIGNCILLEWLSLNDNQISVIPEAIGNLTQLQALHLDHNQISVIPEAIGNCILLETLFMCNNQISVIPEAIGNCTLLQKLDLNNNQILVIPETIGNCTQSKYFLLENNQISHIPDAIVNLSQQQQLCLGNNPILFIYNTSPWLIQKTKPIFNAFKAYGCLLPFSHFFKSVSLKRWNEEEIKAAFQQLKPEDQNLIFEMVCAEAGVASDDLQWGKDHVFDSMPIFYRALKKTISTKFDRLSPEDRNKVYAKIYELAGRPLGNSPNLAEWGEHHAFENVLRLIDAMKLVMKITNS